ncbi:GlmS protein [[Mannheimia] succiniciproducens MBEL55E]|uniref:Glutamine--fructose-6-phosphate aminotransferase [isomerizing] n=1 Tax=Mannheimia succiniciproducens (strain KCTC 0769BP / MBEL55E) TaxID=221988 RepID=Q65W65_MANSM|nr:GlmS protein [[Mannheimia] succiniciproducens MBEL55E]
MCGIVGAVAQRDVAEILVDGLHRLEYRGYDSAGVAVLNNAHEMQIVRRVGKVKALDDAIAKNALLGGNRYCAHPLGNSRRTDRS